jgi:hypothetical protein
VKKATHQYFKEEFGTTSKEFYNTLFRVSEKTVNFDGFLKSCEKYYKIQKITA